MTYYAPADLAMTEKAMGSMQNEWMYNETHEYWWKLPPKSHQNFSFEPDAFETQ